MGSSDRGSPVSLTLATASRPTSARRSLRPGAEVRDVEHEAAHLAGLHLNGEPGQILERLQHLAVGADEPLEIRARAVGRDDRDRRPTRLDRDVDVAVHVEDVQQLLEEVGGDVALVIEALLA